MTPEQMQKIGKDGFKVGQLAISVREGCVIQVRRIRVIDGIKQLGIGKKGVTWVLAKDYVKYKKELLS